MHPDRPLISDQEIIELIGEEKKLAVNFREQLTLKKKSDKKYQECDLSAKSNKGAFIITVKVNIKDVFDFSIILQYISENGFNYILRRYNGTHQHKNILERTLIRGYHIHIATEKYQRSLLRIDGYAELTDSYKNWKDALAQLIADCNVKGENTYIIVPVQSLLTSGTV
ncbi:MAG: hypothetical protein NTU95_02725 [Methanothrix sp.]|nr:hypothetical protein [Methanothrix sp.]